MGEFRYVACLVVVCPRVSTSLEYRTHNTLIEDHFFLCLRMWSITVWCFSPPIKLLPLCTCAETPSLLLHVFPFLYFVSSLHRCQWQVASHLNQNQTVNREKKHCSYILLYWLIIIYCSNHLRV